MSKVFFFDRFSGVVFGVTGLELGDGEAGVYLGGLDVLVAEHFLQISQMGAVFQHVGGAGMPEGVRADFLLDAGFLHVFADDVVNRVVAGRVSETIQKESAVVFAVHEFGPERCDVVLQILGCDRAERDDSVLLAFALPDG